MEIALFVIMLLGTLAFLAYPLLRPASGPAPIAAAGGLCAHCGRALEGDEAFCPACGKPASAPTAPLRCAHCGRALDGDEVFCPGCGRKTGEGRR
mgnify:CR=1 FL=1